jgi:hypothetical protein
MPWERPGQWALKTAQAVNQSTNFAVDGCHAIWHEEPRQAYFGNAMYGVASCPNKQWAVFKQKTNKIYRRITYR